MYCLLNASPPTNLNLEERKKTFRIDFVDGKYIKILFSGEDASQWTLNTLSLININFLKHRWFVDICTLVAGKAFIFILPTYNFNLWGLSRVTLSLHFFHAQWCDMISRPGIIPCFHDNFLHGFGVVVYPNIDPVCSQRTTFRTTDWRTAPTTQSSQAHPTAKPARYFNLFTPTTTNRRNHTIPTTLPGANIIKHHIIIIQNSHMIRNGELATRGTATISICSLEPWIIPLQRIFSHIDVSRCGHFLYNVGWVATAWK